MKTDEFIQLDAMSLVSLLERGEVSATELNKCAFQRFLETNDSINAVVEFYEERLDENWLKSRANTFFHGVPFLIKDVGPVEAGKRREWGSRLGKNYIPEGNDGLFKKYARTGLNVVGRTASPEFAFNVSTEGLFFGATRNPWDLKRSAGGSSGGAAAAVAAGVVPVAHANDGGGSIRIPAACCGVVGLKPSRGRTNCSPQYLDALNGLSCEHVVSRTVRDSAVLLDLTQAQKGHGLYFPAHSPKDSYRNLVDIEPEPLQIAVMLKPSFGKPTEPEFAELVSSIAGQLEQLGHHISESTLDLGVSGDGFIELNTRIWCANLVPWINSVASEMERQVGLDTLEPATLAAYEFGGSLSAVDLLEALSMRDQVTMSVSRFFDHYDLLLCPTLPSLPWEIGEFDGANFAGSGLEWGIKLFEATPFTAMFNVAGNPAISLPLAWSASGLPCGIQLIAGAGREDTLLSVAGQLERALPWAHRYDQLEHA